jgi:hypothetical protein
LFKHNGPKGLCLMLKVYAVTLQQSCGGHVVKDLTELKFRVARSNRGLPRVIPIQHRQMLRAGDPAMIRFYLTLFNLYRVIEFEGDMRLVSLAKTIVSPAKVLEGFETLKYQLIGFVPVFFRLLTKEIGLNARSLRRELIEAHGEAEAFPFLKSSPFTAPLHRFEDLSRSEQERAMVLTPVVSSHPLAIHEAASALEKDAELYEPVHYFLGLLPSGSPIREAYQLCINNPLIGGATQSTKAWYLDGKKSYQPILGKLSLKEESAGKVRVFAMVDCWTQWLLKPLHTTIFTQILSGIDQDGTLDQLKPVRNLIKRDPNSLFSLDLSAATDRLPLWLQQAILGGFAGEIYSQMWADFLVKRDYVLTLKDYNRDKAVRYRLRYAVGQPMGALSSWAMLALTHHFIVQFAAMQAYGTTAVTARWFREYAILGDDIVIGDARVAKAYLNIMRILGVGIGLHKSLISAAGTALEFAKKTFVRGVDVSPVPMSEFLATMKSPAGVVLFIKKYGLTLPAFLKAAGYGYRVLGQLHKPLGKLNSKVRLIILAMNIPYSIEDVEAFFSLGISKAGKAVFETQEVINQMVEKEFRLLKSSLNKLRLELHTLEGAFLDAKDMTRELLKRIKGPKVQLSTMELIRDWFWVEAVPLLTPDARDKFIPLFLQKYPDQAIWSSDLFEFLITCRAELESGENLNVDSLPRESSQFIGMTYNVDAATYLGTLLRIYEAEALKDALGVVKHLQYLTQGSTKIRAMALAEALSATLVNVMLSKYDRTAAEMFISLISLSKEIGALPMASLKYARVVSADERGFTDGMHIRLWKALSGIVQGTKQAQPAKSNMYWF